LKHIGILVPETKKRKAEVREHLGSPSLC
jgi:hypothetical protein